MSTGRKNTEERLLEVISRLLYLVVLLLLLAAALLYVDIYGVPAVFIPAKEAPAGVPQPPGKQEPGPVAAVWPAPDTAALPRDAKGMQIRYGRELVANTGLYFGPGGCIQHNGNGISCQSCHPDAGTRPFGNNFVAVAAAYPKFRERSGTVETIEKRVNDCFERSLNGTAIDTKAREMQAIKAYIVWLGSNTGKAGPPPGSGIAEIGYLQRTADPAKGRAVYTQKCSSCHGGNGEGTMNADRITYEYPPLWGSRSYTTGAGMYRLSRFAGYVKSNMPWGATHDQPQLSDGEAWDLAAYVDSQPHPEKNLGHDWPLTASKPVDYPFGPYADSFTEKQHKYGPFGPIEEMRKKQATTK